MAQQSDNSDQENQLESFPDESIASMIVMCDAEIAEQKASRDALVSELARRYHEEAGKKLGEKASAKVADFDTSQYRVTLSVSEGQKVEWDSDIMMGVCSCLPWGRVCELFDIKVTMSEATFKALKGADPELFEQVQAARTTTPKPRSFTVSKKAL